MPSSFDVVVVGAGPGGYVAAIRAAQLGLSVAVVERQKALGGTCLLWGCIPTKALLEHAHALKIAQGAKEWGLTLPPGEVGIDMVQVQSRKDRIVNGLSKGVEFLFKKHKITWIKGSGRLVGRGLVEVTGDEPTTLQARDIIVATGSAVRGIPGITVDRTRVITSDEAIALREVPKSLAVIGSGAVGVEFASIYRRFGSQVSVIEVLPRLAPIEDEAVSAELEKAFRKRGIKSLTGSTLGAVTAFDDHVELEVTSGGQSQRLSVDRVLVAAGRRPVTEGLGLEEQGIATERGYIKVDAFYRTSAPGVSAIGDVITFGQGGHPQLAHVSSAEGILVAERIAGHHVSPINYTQVPSCTYSDPEIGRVGLTEADARAKGFDVAVGTFPFGVLGRAKIAAEIEGFVKIVSDRKYGEILGVHMIGPRATELVAEAVTAMRLEGTVEDLTRTIHAHPTFSEAFGEAAHASLGAAIHI